MDESPAAAWSEQLRYLGVELPRSRRLLVVDDEPENVDVLAMLLEDNFEVHRALGGREALEICDRVGDFAAVICDQRMPGMTGVEVMAELRRRAPETVRMVLTAYSDLPPIVAAVNQGNVYRLFLKPWDPIEMRAAVADAVWVYDAERALNRLVNLLGTKKRELTTTLAQLTRSRNELLAAERMSTLGRFAAGITHNIRNSLTVMMTLVETVQQSPAEPALVQSAQHAFATLDALLKVANDVATLARGKTEGIIRGRVEMRGFLETLVIDLRKDHPIDITIAPGASVAVFDRPRVETALRALLRRAAAQAGQGTPLSLLAHTPGPVETGLEISWSRPAAAAPIVPPLLAELTLGVELARVVAEAHGGRLTTAARGDGGVLGFWISTAEDAA